MDFTEEDYSMTTLRALEDEAIIFSAMWDDVDAMKWDDDFLDDFWTDRSTPKKSLEQYSMAERQAVREKCFKSGKEDPWSYTERKRVEGNVKVIREDQKETRKANAELPPVKKGSQEFKLILQQARMATGLKQKDVAIKLKVTVGLIAEWESGKSVPTGAQRAALNRILKVVLPKM